MSLLVPPRTPSDEILDGDVTPLEAEESLADIEWIHRALGGRAIVRRHLVPLLLALLVYAFWSTLAVWPLRLFVVLLHEVSHGLAALLTGGRIVAIELSPREGGLCTTAGGWPFVISSAGYISTPLVEEKGHKNVHLVGDCLRVGNLRSVVWRAYETAMKI